jgi:hypothetical protein
MPAQRDRSDNEEWARLFRVVFIFTSAFALAFGVATLVRASDLNFLPF